MIPQNTSGDGRFDDRQLRRIVSEPEFFQRIFDALPMQVVVKSMSPETTGQFLLWNRVAEEWLGLKASEVLGKTDQDFFPPDQAKAFRETDLQVMRSREIVEVPEERILSRVRGERLIRTTKTPIFDDEGEPLALMAVSEDVTEQRSTARELEATLRRLRDERNLFHALLDHLPVCAFAKSARPEDRGAYVLWNRVMEELHGKPASEALGRTSAENFDANAARNFDLQDVQVWETGAVLNIPLQSINYRQAGRRLMHTVKAPVYDEDGSPLAVIGVSEDITERVHAEAERTQATEMLRQLNSRVPGAIYQLRVDANGVRTFSYVSERVMEIYGIPAKEFLADYRLAYSCVVEEDRPRVEQTQLASAQTGAPFHCEFRIRRRDDKVRWVQSDAVLQRDGNITYWHGFIMDVTERKLAEEAQHESEERWQLALAGSEAGVWDWKILTGELFYSDRWRQMFGVSRDDLPRTPQELLELIHPDDREKVRRSTLDLLRHKSDLFHCEYRMRRSDGGYTWILANAKAHFDATTGRPTRMIGTLSDISDRKLVEEQLVEAKEAAESASRAKSDFLAVMSHEIRTPLNGVLGFAELLAGTPLSESQRDYVHTIRESGSNLLHVLNDVLDYSKIEAGKLALESQPTVLREIIESTLETFRVKASAKRLDLVCEIAPGTPRVVSADALRLQQVLMNLVSNAVKFTAKGSVRLAVEPGGEADASGCVPTRFIVADTGIGLSSENLPRLFEPFEQLDASMARRFGGTGLGLSIVNRLVAMMKGRISATSTPGQGTTFVVELALPAIAPAIPLPLVDEIPKQAPGDHPSTSILLVEDNPVNRRLARLMLERLGYTPDEAEDGIVAVKLALRHHYDVILMDIQMPGMDGYEAATRIRETQPETKIIALTAHAMPSDRERSAAHGMCLHLTKPVRIEELRDALTNCVAQTSQNPSSN
ncbi:MAG TPA: PAS domain-containing protein [Chthoniobacterales bacterium]|nr:PAS domain-containing protein [Chthoniobacterales bacterium]